MVGTGTSGALIYSIIRELDIPVEVSSSDFNATIPYVDVDAHLAQDFAFYDASSRIDYYRVNFITMI